uniref:Uncharacterized protein n=1 Tax=Aegilops tauschii subsp. strangulata TaxID=200361 RepID=A0A453EJ54_AEGTS
MLYVFPLPCTCYFIIFIHDFLLTELRIQCFKLLLLLYLKPYGHSEVNFIFDPSPDPAQAGATCTGLPFV